MRITSIHARQILDSRGNPTVEADVLLEDETLGRAAVPSGASTGTHEAVELRDGEKHYLGKSVLKAVNNITTTISHALVGKDAENQRLIDETLINLDGTENKGTLGANALLAVSLAVARAAAQSQKKPLFQYFGHLTGIENPTLLPVPLMNIINGGKHAAGSTDIQEFMILPIGASSFSQALQMGAEIFHTLGTVLLAKGYGTTVGDEGGYAPQVKNGNKEALDLISKAVEKAGYHLGTDIVFGLDVAASELRQNNSYYLGTEHASLTIEEMITWLETLVKQYPIVSIEDGLAEDDWTGWKLLTQRLGEHVQLVGDDLFVTNTTFLEKGVAEKAGNAILIKVNQIGTLTETMNAVSMAKKAHWHAIISHRSGETEDTTIADLAVGLETGQIKTGSLSRTDRLAKYNQLLRIEEVLGEKARYSGKGL